jgi:carbon monoxide dehydrogenase subunit G
MHRKGIITTRLEVKKGNGQRMRFSSSIEIDAPVNVVWALIDELEEWPQWMPSIRKIERVSEGPLTVGSQISVTAKIRRLSVNLLMTITEFLPERSVVMQGKALGTNLTRFYFFEPVNGKTKVTLGGDVSGLLAWLARRGGQAVSDEMVQAAKKRIESPGT